MTRCGFRRRSRGTAGLIVVLMAVSTIQISAQLAARSRPYYDLRQEVTISATVSRVLSKPAPEMIAGSHLLLDTSSGEVDASLGRWGLSGKGAPSIVAGQQIEVAGVMKTLKDHPVLVVRALRVRGQVYQVRNEHGVPISPQARQRSRQNQTEKGESL